MNIIKSSIVFILVAFSANSLAYGGGGNSSKKACKEPKFTQLTPPHLSAVEAESEFSFQASASTNPSTIVVQVKKMPVDVVIKKLKNGYLVTGKLPESLKSTFARVNINAAGTNKCQGNDGWLLKIGDSNS